MILRLTQKSVNVFIEVNCPHQNRHDRPRNQNGGSLSFATPEKNKLKSKISSITTQHAYNLECLLWWPATIKTNYSLIKLLKQKQIDHIDILPLLTSTSSQETLSQQTVVCDFTIHYCCWNQPRNAIENWISFTQNHQLEFNKKSLSIKANRNSIFRHAVFVALQRWCKRLCHDLSRGSCLWLRHDLSPDHMTRHLIPWCLVKRLQRQ